jgi:hypothetical protein
MDDKGQTEGTVSSPSDEEKPDSAEFSNDLEDSSTEFDAPRKKSAEGRIHQLISKNKELEERLASVEKEKEKIFTQTPSVESTVVQKEPVVTPEVQKALEFLKVQGFVTKDELEKVQKETQNRQMLDNEHLRLQTTYDGSDGRPKYDKEKVEDYMRTQGIYNPEVAYKVMNETELLDYELKKAEERLKTGPYIEKGGMKGEEAAQAKAISPEKIAKAAMTPEGRAWYERNRDKILSLMNKGQV